MLYVLIHAVCRTIFAKSRGRISAAHVAYRPCCLQYRPWCLQYRPCCLQYHPCCLPPMLPPPMRSVSAGTALRLWPWCWGSRLDWASCRSERSCCRLSRSRWVHACGLGMMQRRCRACQGVEWTSHTHIVALRRITSHHMSHPRTLSRRIMPHHIHHHITRHITPSPHHTITTSYHIKRHIV